MLMLDVVKNGIIDRVTGRSVAAGPIFAGAAGILTGKFQLYSGAQVAPGVALTAGNILAVSTDVAPWQAGGGGISTISEPIPTTNSNAGTVAFARFYNATYSVNGAMDFSVGVSSSGAECIVSTLTAGTPTITNCSFKLALDYGGMQLSDAIANAMLNVLFSGAPAPNMGGSGYVYVYTGAAPTSAGDAATGTLLLSFATTTTSWATASSGSAALNGSISAVAGAGAGAVPGYARWVKGGYVIQGTVGTSGTVFVIDSMSITSGSTYNLTSASITI